MSSSPTAWTSTTDSSNCSPFPSTQSDTPLALIACGALARPAADLVAQHGWPVVVHPLPPLLHNHPHLIAREVERLASELLKDHERVAVGYADCGTYGALDDVCDRLALERLPGLHCYDVYAGPERMAALFGAEPGTYVVTDFLVRSFRRSVIVELGLDRHPELREDYFGNYRRMVWLAQRPDDGELHRLAQEAAERIGLPLVVVPTGHAGLEEALRSLL